MRFHYTFLPLAMISLQIKQLSKKFGPKQVFRDISFSYSGNVLGISGSNGSGKSTFLQCLAGLQSFGGGGITWREETETIAFSEIQKRMGYAAPYINLYKELSCRENLIFLSKVRHRQNTITQIEKSLRQVGLSSVMDQPFGKLSTGQQQRLRLASALFHQPDILLLDEPGSNLDEAGRQLIQQIVADMQTPNKLLILASNIPSELNLCDQTYSIEKQQFVEEA